MNHKSSILPFLSLPLIAILFLGLIPDSFSQSELKEVIIFVDPPNNNQFDIENEKNNEDTKPTPQPNFTLDELPTSFITGNEYALNSNPISISSDDGINLNNLLIRQIDEWKNDSTHTENFWSRTDQVIMGNFGVINALQNPLTENNYHIDGTKYSKNVKSNLEYFVQERGYDVNNLENVPNHMVTPKKYDLSRSVSKQWENPLANDLDIQHVRDLRDVTPNAFDFTPEQEMQIFRESIKNTSFDIVGALMPRLMVDESMFLPESDKPETQQQKSLNDGTESLVSNTYASEQDKKIPRNEPEQNTFQQTSHIKASIISSEFKPSYAINEEPIIPLFEIISSSIISMGSLILWVILKKYPKRDSKLSLSHNIRKNKHDYLHDVELLIQQANESYKMSFTKDAYEKLSQSMRLFYSKKIGLEKEIVTSDLIPLMKNFSDFEKSLVQKSLHLSNLIEFAKHTEDNKQFKTIISEFTKIIETEKKLVLVHDL